MSQQEKKQYVFYEYLQFLWHKKIWFLILPVLTAAVAAIIAFAVHSQSLYVGKAQVYVGSITVDSLTDPENILSAYSENADNMDVYVSSKDHITIKVSGESEENVKKQLSDVLSAYEEDLVEQGERRKSINEESLATANKRIEALKNSREYYTEALKKPDLDLDQRMSYTELLVTTENALSEYEGRIPRLQGDLTFFEEPEILDEQLSKGKSYVKESIAIGAILGLLLAVGMLTLWKYINTARHDS